MTLDATPRAGACPCCFSPSPSRRWGLVSPFLAERALLQPSQPVERLLCASCGYSWTTRGLSDDEARRLYTGYRGEDYFRLRHRHEPWYSRAINDGIGDEQQMVGRRAVLAQSLARAEAVFGPRPAGRVLDHGGDRGQMLRDLPDSERVVFDLSGVAPDPWARAIDAETLARDAGFDLIMNCQVLEHVNSPEAMLASLHALIVPGGWAYLEVPNETWREAAIGGESARLGWLRFVCRHPRLLKTLDFLSTALRIKLGWIPPLGFWALREHLNFFTPESLRLLMERAGFEVAFSDLSASGISAVGRRRK